MNNTFIFLEEIDMKKSFDKYAPYFSSEKISPLNKLFLIKKDNAEVGLFAIEPLTDETAQSSLVIFPEYRYQVLTKNILIFLSNYPFLHGFKEHICWTKLKSFSKVINSLKKYGISSISCPIQAYSKDKEKNWFKKERRL